MSEGSNDVPSGRWTGRGISENDLANTAKRPLNWAVPSFGAAATSAAASGHWLIFLVVMGGGLAVWLLQGRRHTGEGE